MKTTKILASLGCAALTFATAACSAGTEKTDGASASGEGAFSVVDVAGREVSLDKEPERVVLGEGRAMFAASFLDSEDPGDRVVALGSDLHSAAPSFEAKLFAAHPNLAHLPTIGQIAKGDVTVENLIAHKPDIIVMTLDHKKAAEQSGFLGKLDQAGLKYVFTDFRQKPLENTPKSVEILGKVLGEEDKAKQFNAFYKAKVDDITSRAGKTTERPKTLVWRAAGLKDCCSTVKNSNLGDLVVAAGGENLGDTLLDTESGDVTAEKVLSVQPEQIIATGGSWAANPKKPEVVPHVELGYTATPEAAEKTLAGLLATPGFDSLKAPKEGDLHAVFHQFYDSPYNVFALEQFAKWLHPEEFADLDPVADFAAFHKEYLPFELTGTFFTTLPATQSAQPATR
nr:ABC transporter substrate-binding protein [Corynebacterium lactis]